MAPRPHSMFEEMLIMPRWSMKVKSRSVMEAGYETVSEPTTHIKCLSGRQYHRYTSGKAHGNKQRCLRELQGLGPRIPTPSGGVSCALQRR